MKHLNTTKLSARMRTLWNQSLTVHGAKLFNCMPAHIRGASGISKESFKSMLDDTLGIIPDCPITSDLVPDPVCSISGRNSNSLVDWIKFLKMDERRPSLMDIQNQ